MGAESIIGLVVVLIACLALAAFYEEPTIKGMASTIDDLPAQITLNGSGLWQITILRKSGYLHDVREVRGDAHQAITNALTSCRRSGIYSIIITKNEPKILEFYSTNQDGRGKAIGGFRIKSTGSNSQNIAVPQARSVDYQAIVETGKKSRDELEEAAQKYKQSADRQGPVDGVVASSPATRPTELEPLAEKRHPSSAEARFPAAPADPIKPVDYKSIVEAGRVARAKLEAAAQKYRRAPEEAGLSTNVEALVVELNQTKRALATALLEGIKPGLNEKQQQVLGSLPEAEIIKAMIEQINDGEVASGQPLTFEIPIHFTDSDGTYYENMRLVVAHDGPLGNQDRSATNQPNEGVIEKGRAAAGLYDHFGFPEQDAWEGSVYELGGRPQRCDVKLGFRYTDSNGAKTNRQIRTKAFVPWLNDDNLVLGFCNYRKANRSFATSQMQDVVDLDTGECLDDVDAYLNATYAASDYKKLDDFIDDRMNVVECLLYIARLDGNLTKLQKTIIYDYIKQASAATFLTDAIIQNLIKDFAEDLSPPKFRKLLTQVQRDQPQIFEELCELGEKVVDARRGDAAGGRAALAFIAGVKR